MQEHKNYEIDKLAFEGPKEPYKEHTIKVFYLKEPNAGDALVRIFKNGVIVRKFIWPAYKIYNLQAHFEDIVDGEIEGNDRGYQMAGLTGIH